MFTLKEPHSHTQDSGQDSRTPRQRTRRGDLIKLAREGEFDVIAHGCNCFNTMGAGIAYQMAKEFGCDELSLEHKSRYGDINKLGVIEELSVPINTNGRKWLSVFNMYTQYKWGKALDYNALTLCLRKLNHICSSRTVGKDPLHVGLPMIGAGIAGGNWNRIKRIIDTELRDCMVTIVVYDPSAP